MLKRLFSPIEWNWSRARFSPILCCKVRCNYIWIPRFPDPHDRSLNECLVGYFYKGIEPEPLRMLVSHFRVDHVCDVFDQFKLQCTASVVEMINLKSEKSCRDRQFHAKQRQQIPDPSWLPKRERRAKKVDSAGTKITLF